MQKELQYIFFGFPLFAEYGIQSFFKLKLYSKDFKLGIMGRDRVTSSLERD